MRNQRKYFPVNWIDGMKINKNHFIDQDNAVTDSLHDVGSLAVSPLRYGILPSSSEGEKTFSVSISVDSRDTMRIRINACHAVTSGGVRISLPDASNTANDNNKVLEGTFPIPSANHELVSWVLLFIHPFEKQMAGTPDLAEIPPRHPYVFPVYTIKVVNENDYRQFANHPYSIPVGRVITNGSDFKNDEYYLPPCVSIESLPELVVLHGDVYKFLINMESYCMTIIQNFYKKTKPNETSKLVFFLAEKMMYCLEQAITLMKWNIKYEPPVYLFSPVANLGRVMINAIDMRIGSGKDILVSHLTKWSTKKLQQGELESILENMANEDFSNNNINKSRQKLLAFIQVMSPLFEALSKQEMPDETEKIDIIVKEDKEDDGRRNILRR
jgi:hypothetical protein